MSTTFRRALSGAVCVLVAPLIGAAPAGAAKVVNGDFERGNLSGWEKHYFPSQKSPFGIWRAYSGPFFPSGPMRGPAPAVPAPPQGEFGAITEQGDQSVQVLSQVVSLKPDRRHKLRFKLAYFNQNGAVARGAAGFITPNSLTLGQPNQQFRMDVMKPGAGIRAMGGAVLDRVYRTEVGDADQKGYGPVTANLTPYAGKEVRLRFAVAVTEAPLYAGIDAVKVRTRR